ncbi:MAG: hypothetical protein HRU19_19295 [Pseudobacteriovorax sp.]|nr:hypothetical protein [Pseudobacteriovorax sp.]
MRKLFGIGALCVGLVTSGYALGHDEDTNRLEELKSTILDIAIENGLNRDNLPEVRMILDPLVKELATFRNARPAVEEIDLLEGSWKEVWADDIEPERPGFVTDRDGVYQVVTDQGYFYNIGQQDGPQGLSATGYLRGQYSDAGINLATEFTRVGLLFGSIDTVENLKDQILAIESGEISLIEVPGNSQFPNGPIGATGLLRNLYIDQNLRIATGSNDADGIQDLYVLTRVVGPVRFQTQTEM